MGQMPQAGARGKAGVWIVVANEAAAIIYACERRLGPLEKLCTLHNEAARAKTANLISDRSGLSFDSHGQGRHAMTREKSGPKRHAAEQFAREITGRVEKAHHDGRCSAFALIAAPRFLGMLRHELTATRLPEPFLSIDKDVTGKDAQAISELIS